MSGKTSLKASVGESGTPLAFQASAFVHRRFESVRSLQPLKEFKMKKIKLIKCRYCDDDKDCWLACGDLLKRKYDKNLNDKEEKRIEMMEILTHKQAAESTTEEK